MKKSKDLVDIFTGHTLRTRVENEPDGQHAVIQVKDLGSTDLPALKHIPHRITLRDIPIRQLLQKGDILLLSKGSQNKAVLYEGQFGKAFAISAFMVLRLKTSHLKPEFLVWYINHPRAQEYFNSQRAGTTTLNLSKKAIEELPVPVPALEKQELMMKLFREHEKHKRLVAEYEYNIKLLIDNILNNHLNEE